MEKIKDLQFTSCACSGFVGESNNCYDNSSRNLLIKLHHEQKATIQDQLNIFK
jgi:hypothetical protein